MKRRECVKERGHLNKRVFSFHAIVVCLYNGCIYWYNYIYL